MGKKITVRDIRSMKEAGEKIPMVTAYDYTTAYQADQAGIPLLLVGDSLGMVVLGYDSTIPVTIDDMVHHTKAVVRGAKRSLVVSDLPFMSYQTSEEAALSNAARLVQEGGAHSVKLEGGERVASTVDRIVGCGIPVMGHLGLTPQSIHGLSGYHAQGRQAQEAAQMIRDAHALEEAGACIVGRGHLPQAVHTHHRHRGWAAVRRPSAGGTRHAGPVHRVHAQARQTLRSSW